MLNYFFDYFQMFIIILFLAFFLIILPLVKRRKNERLVKAYDGKISWPFGDLIFNYERLKFRISRISSGGGISTSGRGSFPVLWAYVQASPKIILGNRMSKKFTTGKFLILPPNEEIDLGSSKVLIGSDNPDVIKNVKTHLIDQKFVQACESLFSHDFNHLTISSEIHFQNFLPVKKYVLKYTCLPEKIYQEPEALKVLLKNIIGCSQVLNIHFQQYIVK